MKWLNMQPRGFINPTWHWGWIFFGGFWYNSHHVPRQVPNGAPNRTTLYPISFAQIRTYTTDKYIVLIGNYITNKGCVTLSPCHLHEKVSKGKRRIMKTQLFHHAKT